MSGTLIGVIRMTGHTEMSRSTRILFISVVVLLTLLRRIDCLERPHYRTAYACEGSQLHISCDNGQLIHLIRANYGRFSITICNEHGNTDWSVNCIAPRSFRVLQDRCDQLSSCSLSIASTLFGDPCPGTLKYLEVQYRCTLASTTTASTPQRFPPPWLAVTTQPAWITLVTRPSGQPVDGSPGAAVSSSTAVATTSSAGGNGTVAATSTTVVPVASAAPPPGGVGGGGVVGGVVPLDNNATLASASSTAAPPTLQPPVQPSRNVSGKSTQLPPAKSTITYTTVPTTTSTTVKWDFRPDFCAPIRVRDLNWNWTKQGEESVINCPIGTTGFAKWKCASNPSRWTPENPDLSDCKSAWVTSLANRIEQGDSVVGVATDLVQVTKSKPLYGGDMVETAAILKKMAHKMSERIKILPINHKEDVVKELMKSVVETGSNILSVEQRHSWNDLSRQSQMRTTTALLLGLEENAYLLADQINYEKVTVQSDQNILMSVKVLRTQNIRELNFPEPEDLSNSVWGDQASAGLISLPAEALLDRASNGLIKVIFFTYNNIDELLQPPPTAAGGSAGGGGENGELAAADPNSRKVLNSRVISASFGRKHHMPLRQPVFVTLRHMREDNVSNPTCVYWDYTRSTWSPSGCEVVVTNISHTVCACNHLTNFALLMDVRGIQLSPEHEVALQLITYIGCGISIVCLTLAFLTFSCLRALKGDRNTIHKNLCACLLIAEILFVAGISQTDKPILCGVVAGLLHFFFLCAFAWMFLEGFQLYVMLIEVFESEKSRLRWYYALAYGLSALVVAISCIVDPFSYGTDKYCWLRTDNYFIFSFVGPVIAIMVANAVFLSIAIFMMCRHASVSVAVKKKEQSKLANVRTWIRGAVVLVFLLGLTWTFGLLYLNEESVVMAYVFTILNSLQGLFIFVFHCIRNEKVQKEYRKLIRHSPCLPQCLRDGAKERRSSFYVNSNGCTASVPNSSSSPVSSQQQQQSYLKRLWGSGKSRSPPTSSQNGDLSTSTLAPGLNIVLDQEAEKMSYESNRDSGHGGSEPEESTAASGAGSLRFNNKRGGSAHRLNHHLNNHQQHHHHHNLHHNALDGYGGIANDLSLTEVGPGGGADSDGGSSSDYFRQKMLAVNNNHQHQQSCLAAAAAADFQQRSQRRSLRIPPHLHSHHHNNSHVVRMSPLNHIYMDIDSSAPRIGGATATTLDCEPVYEEIDRGRQHEHDDAVTQVSDDYSADEDGRRRSDISRQSSGSYGDNRPLIASHLANSANNAGPTATAPALGVVGGVVSGGSLAARGGSSRQRPSLLPQQQQQQQQPDVIVPEGPPYHVGQLPPHPQPIVPRPTGDHRREASFHGHPSTFHSAAPQLPAGQRAVESEVGGPGSAMFVAMLDGRKVVCKLQPHQMMANEHHHNAHHNSPTTQHYPTHQSQQHQLPAQHQFANNNSRQSQNYPQQQQQQHHIHRLTHSEC